MGEGTLIQLDGVPTYFVDSGGTRTPLLLIHGSGPGIDGPMSWAPVIDDLGQPVQERKRPGDAAQRARHPRKCLRALPEAA